MENNEENRSFLAERVVDGWGMRTLVNYAIYKLSEHYATDEEHFLRDLRELQV